MDTFFATNKSGKSSQGHTCCQLFVTDKSFVYVVHMKSKGGVIQAIKKIAKDIGAPEEIICNAAFGQTSNDLYKFFIYIGTNLRALEEVNMWENKAEFYIGLIKDSVRKDTTESDCPIASWGYCV